MKKTAVTFLSIVLFFWLNGCTKNVTLPTYRYPPKKVRKPVKPTPAAPQSRPHYPVKEVQDDNFSPEYMYPDTDTQNHASSTPTQTSLPTVDKAECVSMIGEEKFKRYTEMLGGEAGALKRCALLRSMQ